MPDFTSILINAGGLGAACYMLYMLHTSALKAFREELANERLFSSAARKEERDAFNERGTAQAVAIGDTIKAVTERQTIALSAELQGIQRALNVNSIAVANACRHEGESGRSLQRGIRDAHDVATKVLADNLAAKVLEEKR